MHCNCIIQSGKEACAKKFNFPVADNQPIIFFGIILP